MSKKKINKKVTFMISHSGSGGAERIYEIRELSKELLNEHEPIFRYPTLITAERLTKQKGQWYLIRVFKALKEKHKDLKLVILGEGELKEYLVKLSEELRLKTYVWDRDELSVWYSDVCF
jgi:glycosyltransferase involved in cell wall biosynthesis